MYLLDVLLHCSVFGQFWFVFIFCENMVWPMRRAIMPVHGDSNEGPKQAFMEE